MKYENLIFIGKTKEVTLPSGRVIIIRETTGEDESLLSQLKLAQTGDSIIYFLSNVIKNQDGTVPTREDILSWFENDVQAALLYIRMLSLGEVFIFPYTCTCNPQAAPVLMEQDLNEFILGSDTNNALKPYPKGLEKTIEFNLSSGKTLRFSILTNNSKDNLLEDTQDSINKNTSLLLRNLEILHEGSWEKVTHFKMFSSREMIELRKVVDSYDPSWVPYMHVVCPKCGKREVVDILTQPDFFFPTEIKG